VLSVYYDKICIKFTSHHLLYVVYMCQKSLNFTHAFKCYQQNVSGFTLAGPPCMRNWTVEANNPVFSPILATGVSSNLTHLNRMSQQFNSHSICSDGAY